MLIKIKGKRHFEKKKNKKVIIIICLIIIFIAGGIFGLIKFYPSIGTLPSQSQQKAINKKIELYYNGEFHNSQNIQWVDVEEQETLDLVSPQITVLINKRESIEDSQVVDMTITWFGYSTSLLQIHGMNILIDPIFSKYASPVSFMGTKRFLKSPYKQKIYLILILFLFLMMIMTI